LPKLFPYKLNENAGGGSSGGQFDVQLNLGGSFAGAIAWTNVVGDAGSAYLYTPRDRSQKIGSFSSVYAELMDMNGDGLPDRVLTGGIQLNNGVHGFGPYQTTWNYSIDPGLVNVDLGCYTKQLMDMNGDGLPDFVFANGGSTYTVFFNTGRGFDGSGVTWSGINTSGDGTAGWTNLLAWDANYTKVTFLDMNGDGLVDRVERNYTGAGSFIVVELNSGPFPDLLTGVDNGIGGSVALTYTSSTSYNNSDGTRPRLPFPVYTVSSVTVDDSHGNTATTTYDYANGSYDTTYREFRGFGLVTETDPLGAYTTTWFHQGGGTNASALGEFSDSLSKSGMAFRSETYGSDNKLYTRTLNQILEVKLHTNGVYFPFVQQTINQNFEGNGTSNYRATAAGYAYNAISNNLAASTGNLLSQTNYGEVGTVNANGHTFTALNTVPPVYKQYAYASIGSNPEIIDRVASVTISADSAGSIVLKQTTNSYWDVIGDLKTKNDLICLGTYATSSFTYDDYGNVLTTTDPVGIITTTEYDTATATYPIRRYTGSLSDNLIESTQYDPRAGVVTVATNLQGLVTSNAYDVFFRVTNTLTSTTQFGAPTLSRQRIEYKLIGIGNNNVSTNFVHVSKNDPADASGFHDTWTYLDGLGRPIQTRDESETAGQYRVGLVTYDERGSTVLETYPFFDSGSNYVKYTTTRTNVYTEYDKIGRAFRVNPVATAGFNSSGWWNGNNPTVSSGDSSSPVGSSSIGFDEGNNPWVVTVTNALGQVHKYYEDAYGRTNQIVEVTSQGNFTNSLGYDLVNNLTNITDSAGNKIAFFVNLLGQRVAMADPNMGFWQWGMDAAGRLKIQTDAKGQQQKLFYETGAAGRLTRKEGWTAANICVSTNTYAYDSSLGDSAYTVFPGQLFSVTDDEGWQKNSYDVRSRTLKTVRYLSKNGQSYTNQVTFDDADRVSSQIYPNGGPTLTNIFDSGGHLSQVKQVGGSGTIYFAAKGFNALNQSFGVNFGNGIQTTNSYYLISKRLNQIASFKTTNIQSLAYSYDQIGNIKGITDGVYSGTNSATLGNIIYDDLNRLTSLTNTSGPLNYAFDSVGNILTNKESGSGSYVYNTNRPHMAKSANGIWYTSDQNGNVLFRSGQRLDYNVNNWLTRVWGTNGVLTTFGHDANGARLWKQSGTNSLQVWIGRNYEEKNGQILFHVLAGGQTVCTFDKTGTNVFQYYHPNNLTSTSIQTDTNGNRIQHYEYSPFGQSRSTESGSAFPISRRYTGQILDDDTGLYYYNFRYYDPQLARFIQPDDIIPDLANPQSYNRYSYVLNNPLRFTDPTGHSDDDLDDIPLTVGGAHAMLRQQQSAASAQLYNKSGTEMKGVAATGRAIAEINPVVGAFNGTYEAVSGKDAIDSNKELTGWQRTKSAGGAVLAVAPVVLKTGKFVKVAVAAHEAEETIQGIRAFKSFDAFKRVAGPAGEGQAWHHIVEQSQVGRFGAEAIHNTENIVKVSTEVNQKINGIYSSINKGITGSDVLTVRQWLSTKSYEEAKQFGQQILQKVQAGQKP
jgi:RHS repeat-associated protein